MEIMGCPRCAPLAGSPVNIFPDAEGTDEKSE
jgi:hypothetical protein